MTAKVDMHQKVGGIQDGWRLKGRYEGIERGKGRMVKMSHPECEESGGVGVEIQ